MSGHNRWSKIKRVKEAMGATKGKLFSKLIKEVTVAARMGGGDPEHNARLRTALTLSKAANIPSDSITRAVKKGTGELEGINYEECVYEGYGPGGVAMIVECVTDNKNRTAGDIRNIFTKGGGNMGESGSVKFMFDRKGVILIPQASEDALMEAALEAGALDIINLGADGFEVRTEPNDVHKIAAALEQKGFKPSEAKAAFLPQTTVKLEGDKAEKMLKLMGNFEDCDDVQNIHANFEMDEKLMEQLAGD
ncbi:MAG TPA: YebC/PmpR family DNA-binding transcriptional regulator [Myxococcales bacterium]|jgi:YebC/PmpR family DNA-binding regulatory protein